MQLSFDPDYEATSLHVALHFDPRNDRLTVALFVKNEAGIPIAKCTIKGEVKGDVLGLPDFLRDVGLHWLYGVPSDFRGYVRRSWANHLNR